MTDCNDINEQIRKQEEELERIRKMRDKQQAIDDNLNTSSSPLKKKNFTVLTAIDGSEMTVNFDEWAARAEEMAMELSDPKLERMISEGLAKQQRPVGRTGHMINFAMIDPTKENFAKVLELEMRTWRETPGGKELRRPFRQPAAGRAVLSMMQRFGGDGGIDPRLAAKHFEKQLPGIHKLPVTVYTAAKFRHESSMLLADALEDAANAIETNIPIPDAAIAQLKAVTGWAHYFEQLDSTIRRKVGQGLQSLQKDMENGIEILDIDKDITELSWDEITGDSFLAQVIDHINKEDPLKLRKLATAKRLLAINEAPINESAFAGQLRLLNHYRRGNLFTSIATHIRNVASGTLVGFDFFARDLVKTALLTDFETALKAHGQMNKQFLGDWQTALNNASEAFKTGRQRMGGRNLKEVSPEVMQDSKIFIDTTINNAWDRMFNMEGVEESPAAGLAMLNLINAGWRKMLGKYVSEQFFVESMQGDWGYFPSYRALGAEDELVRGTWGMSKIHIEAFREGYEIAKGSPMPSENLGDRLRGGSMGGQFMGPSMNKEEAYVFAQQYADDAVEKAVFNIEKQFSDEDLKKLRFSVGMPIGESMDNDTLRLHLFNQLQGVPNTTNKWGAMLKQRGDEVTFTQKFTNKAETRQIGNAMQMMRRNPYVSLAMPTFQTGANGIGGTIDSSLIRNLERWARRDFMNARGRSPGREELADIRAGLIVALGMATFGIALSQAGLVNSGYSPDPRERERQRTAGFVPYSITSPNWTGDPQLAVKTQVGSVDWFDLQMLQRDQWDAVTGGFMSHDDHRGMMPEIINAYGSFLRQKNMLRTFVDFYDAFQDNDGNGEQWVKAFSSVSNGMFPAPTGLLGNIDRMFEADDAGLQNTRRRYMTSEEMTAMEKNEIWNGLRPIRSFLEKSVNSIPIADDIWPAPKSKDWLGTETRARFLGIPADKAVPFTQVIVPNDPLYHWLEKHGIGSKPWPDGKISQKVDDQFVEIQLGQNKVETSIGNMGEEELFREAMHSTPGSAETLYVHIPMSQITVVESLLGRSMERLVEGKTMTEALRLISKDPDYNAALEGGILETPEGPISTKNISPSLTQNPGKGLSYRQSRDKYQLLLPVNAIINYYKQIALGRLINEVPSFKERINALYEQEAQRDILKLESSPQGVGYQ